MGRACALGGRVLLLGVGHGENTTLHLAESLARVPYRARKHCTVLRDGLPARAPPRGRAQPRRGQLALDSPTDHDGVDLCH